MKRVLDLFCCAGGATRGYQRAGFHVTGVDVDCRPDYIGDDFVQGDAIEFALNYAKSFDFISASPPCQSLSTITPEAARGRYFNLIPSTRDALAQAGVPFVMENVVSAVKRGGLRRDLMLCGEMFGLRVIRHRVFEFGHCSIPQPDHLPHRGMTKGAGRRSRGTYSRLGYYFAVYGDGTDKGTTSQWCEAMGIDWMTDRHDLAEALPPAYTEYIGRNVLIG